MIYFILFWGICYILNYGFIFSYNRHEFPNSGEYEADLFFSLVFAFTGPIGLLVIVCSGSTKHGLKFW
jgi:hypothetical protein